MNTIVVFLLLMLHAVSAQARAEPQGSVQSSLSEEADPMSSELGASDFDDQSTEVSMLDLDSERPRSAEVQFQSQMQELGFEDAWIGLQVGTKAKVWGIFRACLQERKSFHAQWAGPNGLVQRGPTSFLSMGAKTTKDALRTVLGATRFKAKPAPATQLMDALVTRKVSASKLDAEQAVCLAMCVASNAFDYKLNTRQVFRSMSSSVEQTWNAPTGICWDYTRLAAHTLKVINRELQKRLGRVLSYRTSSNLPHSFIEVRFNDKGPWFGVDPTPEYLEDPRRAGYCTLVDRSLPRGPRLKKKW